MRNNNNIEVDKEEILYFIEHSWTGFPSLVLENLKARGIKSNRQKIHKELTSIKKSYDRAIIESARHLLKSVKGLEYSSNPY